MYHHHPTMAATTTTTTTGKITLRVARIVNTEQLQHYVP
jgi:hypothetical protein